LTDRQKPMETFLKDDDLEIREEAEEGPKKAKII